MLENPEQSTPSLADLRDKYGKDNTGDTSPTGLPLILDSTYEQLASRYLIPIANDSPTPPIDASKHPYRIGLEVAATTMNFFQTDERSRQNGMFYQICQWLDQTFSPYNSPQFHPDFKDAATVGLTLVFNAFAIELAQRNFLEQLRQADPGLLLKAFSSKSEPFIKNVAIVDRLRNSEQPFTHQIFLDDFVDRFKTHYIPAPPLENAFLNRALKGYHVSEAVWNSLPSEPTK